MNSTSEITVSLFHTVQFKEIIFLDNFPTHRDHIRGVQEDTNFMHKKSA